MKTKLFNFVARVTAVATLVSSILVMSPVNAASFTSVSDTLSNEVISNTANHLITLTLPTGVNFDGTATDVLIYDFPADFVQTGSWQVADFAFNDGTARTVNAVSQGAGTSTVSCVNAANNIGVAVDVTANVFRVIPCGADYTASANAATTTFTIYGNTSTGTGILTNPTVIGNYNIDLSMTINGTPTHSYDLFVPITDGTVEGLVAIKDTMTRLKISTTSDHVITSTLPSTADFGTATGTDVLTYDFPADFVQSGTWQTTDFAFSDGTTRAVIGVAAGAGTATLSCTDGADNVGVAVDTTGLVFRVIPCTTSFTESALGASVTFTIYGTSTTGQGVLTNPATSNSYQIALSMYDNGGSNNSSSDLFVPIVDDDQVTVTANVDPAMSFDIDTSIATAAHTAAPYTVAFDTISTTDSRVSGTTDSVNFVMIDLGTNATSGAVVTVQNEHGTIGMQSTSDPSDYIPNSTGLIADGTENYGFCLNYVNQTSGSTLTGYGTWGASSVSCTENTETNVTVAMSTTPADILTATGPIDAGRAVLVGGASINSTTPAHNDYHDTLTFIGTATY